MDLDRAPSPKQQSGKNNSKMDRGLDIWAGAFLLGWESRPR
jgi:hypothetical protein